MQCKTLILISSLLMLTSFSLSAEHKGAHSLRGGNEITSMSEAVDMKRKPIDRDVIPRYYDKQPPLIPHRVKGYKINLRSNKCLTCHGPDVHVAAGAVKIGDSHFYDRDGNKLDRVSPRRYFCNQCHVTQVDAEPLVENEFRSIMPSKSKK
ncbi:MAG: nitrate reductase cytochrome c-type subunit [Gammaproteobacteria bacterium]|nr:nitrate reductase cytochrome c-type subunit [Gammaproteobacteria bacterium]MDH5731283.1 nitrate reductase cytochrome c-type subunit [Gammaproteobacteria bacterium]